VSKGGVMLQNFNVDGIEKFNDYNFFFYGTNIFEDTYARGSGGAIAMTYGSRI
jgi:predicted outer membrane repeat protein